MALQSHHNWIVLLLLLFILPKSVIRISLNKDFLVLLARQRNLSWTYIQAYASRLQGRYKSPTWKECSFTEGRKWYFKCNGCLWLNVNISSKKSVVWNFQLQCSITTSNVESILIFRQQASQRKFWLLGKCRYTCEDLRDLLSVRKNWISKGYAL